MKINIDFINKDFLYTVLIALFIVICLGEIAASFGKAIATSL